MLQASDRKLPGTSEFSRNFVLSFPKLLSLTNKLQEVSVRLAGTCKKYLFLHTQIFRVKGLELGLILPRGDQP